MKRYTSSYCAKDNNYILDIFYNLVKEEDDALYSTFCVVQNIIQRGNPSKPSQYLLNSIENYKVCEELKYISNDDQYWDISIKGYNENNDNPALYFYKEVIRRELKEYGFLKNLILPEAYINDITGEENIDYTDNTVDFYIPQLKLVLEIDGMQHSGNLGKIIDSERDLYLETFDIKTIRISAADIKDYRVGKVQSLKTILSKVHTMCKSNIAINKYMDFTNGKMKYENYKTQIVYDSILRFQVLILELLKGSVILIDDKKWIFNIKDDGYDIPYENGVKDIENYLKDLLNLQGINYKEKNIEISKVKSFPNNYGVNIDLSLFKKWDDYIEDNICLVRSDYEDDKNYFEVATGELIEYDIKIEGDEKNVDSLCNLNRNIFGFGTFNNGQLPIIINALSKIDTLGLLPTGGGKSLCYQLCCMLQPTINFVVVPIKSLMYDQKINLDKKGVVNTSYLSSDQEGKEKEEVLKNFARLKYFYIWISPERFQTETFREQLNNINLSATLGYAVIDEVHCLSEWGHDFRTSYLNLSKTIRKYCPGVVMFGLTATASKNVLKDILVEFEMKDENVKTIVDYTRKELAFEVIQDKEDNKNDKYKNLTELLLDMNRREEISKIDGEKTKCGIIFTPHANGNYGCYGLSNKLNTMDGFRQKIGYYSGEVPKINKMPIMSTKVFNEYKKKVQEEFQNNKFPLLAATKAFGMGVDKGNVRYTVHYGIPSSIESFYQEAGRAGRDKKNAKCYVLHTKDVIPKEELDKVFALDTTIEELKYLVDKYKFPAGDVLRNLFLATSNQTSITEEAYLAYHIYKNFCSKGDLYVTVSKVKDLNLKIKGESVVCNFASIQKAIYRLSLLGIIEDWVVDGWNERGKFKISIGKTDEEYIKSTLIKYIRKYDVEFDIDNLSVGRHDNYLEVLRNEKYPLVYKYLAILIQWNYDNVFYNRRQSQKNLYDLCDSYFEKGKDFFKEVLEGYFKITDNSYVLDYLISNPYDIAAMYQILYEENGDIKEGERLMEVNLALIRFLESFRYNTALNYLSGMISLMVREKNNELKVERLKSAFEIIFKQDEDYKNEVLKNTYHISKKFDIEQKDILGEVLCNYISNEEVYKNIEDNFSLRLILNSNVERLKKVRDYING